MQIFGLGEVSRYFLFTNIYFKIIFLRSRAAHNGTGLASDKFLKARTRHCAVIESL